MLGLPCPSSGKAQVGNVPQAQHPVGGALADMGGEPAGGEKDGREPANENAKLKLNLPHSR